LRVTLTGSCKQRPGRAVAVCVQCGWTHDSTLPRILENVQMSIEERRLATQQGTLQLWHKIRWFPEICRSTL